MSGLSFGEPLSLMLLVVLVPLWWLWRLETRRRAAADAAYGGAPSLRLGQRARRRGLRVWLLAAALVLLVVAVARPQWGIEEAPVERRGVDIAIALDVSRSMTASDVAPSRAAAAAAGIGDLFTHLRSDRVGLVIFSGTAFERSPLTLDLDALGQLVEQAQRDSELVDRGTDLGAAIDEALMLLDVEDAADSQVMIVVSDGEDLSEAALAAAGRAASAGVPIYTVAVGTDVGASIPGDRAGIDASRADRETLRAVAGATGGEFRELNAIAGLAIEVQRLRQSEFDDDQAQQPIERFQWFVAPALVLLVLPLLIGEAARRRPMTRQQLGSAAILGSLVLGACGGSQLYRNIEDGNRAYDEARYDDALGEYRDAALAAPGDPAVGYNVGNTLHRLRRYEEATVASSDALALATEEGLVASLRYALGNHAVMRGALEEARERYIEVLRLSPDDEDAKANLELVLAQLEPPVEEPDEAPTGVSPGEPEPGGDATGDDGPPDPGEPGAQPSDDGDPGGETTGGGGDPGDAPPGDADPSDGTEGGEPGEPGGDASGAGTDAVGATLTLEEAEAALAAALSELGAELTLEEAAELLELIRQLSEVEPLDPIRSGGGGFGDR
jgi:Ca-activated chloride channel family protein